MAKLKMKRFDMVALLEDSKDIVDLLQRKGVVEFSKLEAEDGYEKLETARSVSFYDKQLAQVQRARAVLSEHCPRKTSFLDSFKGKKELTVEEYDSYCADIGKITEKCIELERLSHEIAEEKAHIIRQQVLIDGLMPWKDLDIPMLYSRTESTSVFIGSIQRSLTRDELLSLLAAELPETEAMEIEIVSSSPEQTCIVAVCFKDDAKDFLEALRSIGFSRPSDMTRSTPAKVIDGYKAEITAAKSHISELQEQIKQNADFYDDIDFVCDYYLIQKDKYEVLERLGLTRSAFFVRGFVPEKYSPQLKQELEARFRLYIHFDEPDEDDDVPVLLENNSFVSGVEGITGMYSLPGKKDVDPNPVMSFFYYALFGLMLSDAGYGVLMMLFTAIAKKKLKLSESLAKSMTMFFWCGAFSVFWGTLFGGWFGDAVTVISGNFFGREIDSVALWFEPVDDPMRLLLFSFLFGIIHLFAGLAVRFYAMCKEHNLFGAVCDVVPVYIFVTGFAIIGAGLITNVPPDVAKWGKYLLAAGCVLIILTAGRSSKNIIGKLGGGLYGLYNTASGYLGDILSYSRLLALCLVTGVIANVVNMLASMPQNVVLKAVAFVPIFIFGHVVNIAINLIGTYVHTNRLQYVEFFSKFYEGGGRSFTPFNVRTNHYIFKEETYNG